MSSCRTGFLAVFLGGALACAPPPESAPAVIETDDPGGESVARPALVSITPTTWTAGTTVKVIGGNFLGADAGRTTLRLVGSVIDAGGASHAVDMSVTPTYRAANKLDFVFEPDAPPAGFGTALGTFTGQVTATNVGKRGSQARSDQLATNISIGPSILVDLLWPLSQGCPQKRAAGILNGDLVGMELSVIGVPAASAAAPIPLAVAYVDVTKQARSIDAAFTDGTSTGISIDPGMLAPGDNNAVSNDVTTSRDVTVSLTANAPNGTVIHRTVTFTVSQPYEVTYDGNSDVIEMLAPMAVTGCLPGGQNGANFTYHEDTNESRDREYELSSSFDVDLWILNLGFGFRVRSSVSSGTDTSLGVSHGVFPHWYGAFYRQTSKLLRTGDIVRTNACGEHYVAGSAYVTDWTWAPGFAQTGGGCPPLPSPGISELGAVLMNP